MGFGVDLGVIEAVAPLLGSLDQGLPVAEGFDELVGGMVAVRSVHAGGPGRAQLQKLGGLAGIPALNAHEIDGKLAGSASGSALRDHLGMALGGQEVAANGAAFRGFHGGHGFCAGVRLGGGGGRRAAHDAAQKGGRDGDGFRARIGLEALLAGGDQVVPVLHLGARFLAQGNEYRVADGGVILQHEAQLGEVVKFIFVNAAGDLVDVVVQAPKLALITEQQLMLGGRDALRTRPASPSRARARMNAPKVSPALLALAATLLNSVISQRMGVIFWRWRFSVP